jgi:putative glycerol kinase 5
LEIPHSVLPQVLDTSGEFGFCVGDVFDLPSASIHIPITSIVGDQQASLFGQCCFEPGDTKVTMGTGSFVNINTGDQPYASKSGLYPMVAWRIGKETAFMIEGCDRNGGAAIEWAKDIGFFEDISKLEESASSVSDTNGAYFVPGKIDDCSIFFGLQVD